MNEGADWRRAFRCGLEQITFTPCLVLVKPGSGGRTTDQTDCDEAGDYVVPNVLSPRDLVSRHDNRDEIVPRTNLNPFSLMLQILINATVGSSGYKGDIAIDDLSLSVSNCSQ